MAYRSIWEWVDGSGGYLRSGIWTVSAGAGMGPLETDATILSNAGLNIVTTAIPDIVVSSPSPGNTWYLVTDTAEFLFTTTALTTVRIVIPGPNQAIFKADTLTIDPTNTDVANFISSVIAQVTDSAGNSVAAFAQGQRGSRRTEQNSGN